MRNLSFIFFFILSSCSKNDIELSDDYNNFVGLWKETYGESHSSFEFKENGYILYKNGIDRGFKRKVIQFSFSKVDPELGWKRYLVQLENGLYMSFFISDFGDSLWAGGTQIDNESVQQQTNQYYTKIQ